MSAAPDLLCDLGGLPPDLVAGLDLLASSPPLWPIGLVRWATAVESVKAFARHWDDQARSFGWSPLHLYGLHRHAPYANLAGMAVGFLLAATGHKAVAVDTGAFHMDSVGGNRLRALRCEPDPAAVLAWSLCYRLRAG